MRRKFTIIILFVLLLSTTLISEELIILNPEKPFKPVSVVFIREIPYLNIQQLAEVLEARVYYRPSTGKLVLYFSAGMLKLGLNSSFCMVDSKIFQLEDKTYLVGKEVWAPLNSIVKIIKAYFIPEFQYQLRPTQTSPTDSVTASLPSKTEPRIQKIPEVPTINPLKKISIEERSNGLTVKIETEGVFNSSDFSYFIKDEWVYVTIYRAIGDPNKLSLDYPHPAVIKIEALPQKESVQLNIRLKQKVDKVEIVYSQANKQILIALFYPLTQSTIRKIENIKNKWIVDTIVLDPGHGGHDPGTPSRWKGHLNEKDIVLDIALRVGEILSRRKDIKIVYTRQKDEFVPLWKRSKIANDSNGKLFVSLHVNATLYSNPNSSAEGIEIYLQNPISSSKDAIEIAKKENEVIKYESSEDRAYYANYDNPSHILASMIHQTYMQDSEKFAEILSKNFSKYIPHKNRGVKQANFYVLVGASMPSVLCEIGYIDNKKEADKLNEPTYRQKLAEAIARSIIEFKEYCDRAVK